MNLFIQPMNTEGLLVPGTVHSFGDKTVIKYYEGQAYGVTYLGISDIV